MKRFARAILLVVGLGIVFAAPHAVFAVHNTTITLESPIVSCSGVQSEVEVNWTVQADHGNYFVERKLSTEPETLYTQMAGSFSGSGSYIDQVTSGVTYNYRIRGEQGPNTIFSNVVSITSEYCGAVISGTSASCQTDGPRITVTWLPATGSVDHYEIEQKKEGEAGFTLLANAGLNTSYADGPQLEATKTYEYRVKTVWQSAVERTTTESAPREALACPVNMQIASQCLAVSPGGPSNNLSWNSLQGVQKYQVYRQVPGESTYSLLADNILGTSYSDNLVTSHTSGYFNPDTILYFVRAVWIGGQADSSDNTSSDVSIDTLQCAPFLQVSPTCADPNDPSSADGFQISWTATQSAQHYNINRNGQFLKQVSSSTLFEFDESPSQATWDYQVTAVTSTGNFSSNSVTDSIDCTISTPPDPPVLQEASPFCSAGDSRVHVEWSAVPNVTSYTVYRTTQGGGGTTTFPLSASTVSWDDAGVESEFTYDYWVTATGPGGESIASNVLGNVTALSCTPPTIPQITEVSAQCVAGNPEVTISWSSDDGNTVQYVVRRSSDGGATFPFVVGTFSQSDAEYSAKTVQDLSSSSGQTYHYKVVAQGPVGVPDSESAASQVVVPSCAPPAPSLGSSPVCVSGSPRVDLSWSVSGTTNIDHFEVFRGGVQLAHPFLGPSATSYQDATVSGSTSYTYRVEAVGQTGLRTSSADSSLTTSDCSAPGAFDIVTPIQLTCTGPFLEAKSSGNSGVAWTPSSNITSYDVLRTRVNTGTVVTHTNKTSPFLDSGFGDAISSTPEQYTWQVRANGPGGTTFSSEIASTAPICAPAQPAVTSLAPFCDAVNNTFPISITIAWTDTINTTSYEIYRNTTGAGPLPGDLIDAVSGTTFSYTDTAGGDGLQENTGYYYWIRAVGPTGLQTTSVFAFNTTPACILPTVPQNLQVVFECTGSGAAPGTSPHQATLSWEDSDHADYYQIYKNGSSLDTVTDNNSASYTFSDDTIAVATEYTYSVAAFGSGGKNVDPDPIVVLDPALDANGNYCRPSVPGASATTFCASGEAVNTITWTDAHPFNTQEYEIYRNGTLVQTTSSTSWQDTGSLAPSTLYSYEIKAIGPTGLDSALSAVASVTTLACGVVPPAPSISVTGNQCVAGNAHITLDWSDTTNALSYDVYRDGQLTYQNRQHPFQDSGSYAVTFDGTSDYVETNYTTNLRQWTAAVWVKSPATPANSAPNGPIQRDRNFLIDWNHTNPVFRGAASLHVGGTWYAATFGQLNANTWYHLIATYDGESLKAYKNGILITTNNDPSGNPSSTTVPLQFGKRGSFNNFLQGTVDDVRIYNRALSASEISDLHNGNFVSPYGLVGMWHFDEGSGTSAKDDSGNGNNGTLQGLPDWVQLFAGDATYDSDSLQGDTSYSYTVRALGVDTESGNSNAVSEIAVSCVPGEPNLRVTHECQAGSSVLQLEWDPLDSHTDYVEVYKKRDGACIPEDARFTFNVPQASYSDTNVESPGVTYEYCAVGFGPGGSGLFSPSVPATTDVCADLPYEGDETDMNLSIAAQCSGSVPKMVLLWDEDSSGNTTSYNVLRQDVTGGGSFVFVVSRSSTQTNYTDSSASVIPGNEYIYKVEAVGPGGITAAETPLTEAKADCDTAPPEPAGLCDGSGELPAPCVVVVSKGNQQAVSLSWTDSFNEYDDPDIVNKAGYRVFRDGSPPSQLIDSFQGGDLEFYGFVDNVPADNTTYTYQIRSYNDNTDPYVDSSSLGGVFSNEREVFVPIAIPGDFDLSGAPVGNTIRLNWEQAATTEAGRLGVGHDVLYEVYRGPSETFDIATQGTLVCTVEDIDYVNPSVSLLECVDANPDASERWYRVVASNGGGSTESDTEQFIIIIFPEAWRETSPF